MGNGRRWLVGLAAAGALAGATCSGGGGDDATREPGVKPDAATSCPVRAGERPAKRVLRCTEDSVAFVETEGTSGTGVVVELSAQRYVLTNQHVVDPLDAATVTLGDVTFEDLPVVGADVSADIALLGPLSGGRLPQPLVLTPGTGLERGDDVFLVGFPGATNTDDLETTIAAGIVSRLRSVKEFSQTYIQTDAAIAGGQSGGPLFDGEANLVGISGLSFGDDGEFALVLSGRDVKAAARRIIDGGGDDFLRLPARSGRGQGATSGSLKLHDGSDEQSLFLPAADGDRTWTLAIDPAARPIVTVETAGGEALAVSAGAEAVRGELARHLAEVRGGRPDELDDPEAEGHDPRLARRETAPGRFTIPVREGQSAFVYVAAPLTDGPVEVAWQSDLALFTASRPVTEQTIEVGDDLDSIIGGFDTTVDVLVELAAGQKVQAHARSPQGDPGFEVFGPEARLDHVTVADPEAAGAELYEDTDDGLFGVDAKATISAGTGGVYRFRLYTNDYTSTRVRFSIMDCAEVECAGGREKEKVTS